MDLTQLRGLTPAQVLKAAWGKFVFRRTQMGFYTIDVGQLRRVHADGYRTQVLPASAITHTELANPYVSRTAFTKLQSIPGALCVLVRQGGQVVASDWYLHGEVPIEELGTSLRLPDGSYYCCRTFVDPDHRGQKLSAHTTTAFIEATPECRTLCCVIFDWNKASVQSGLAVGWARTGTMSSYRIFGHTRQCPVITAIGVR